MTDGDVAAVRPPDHPPAGPEWLPIPGAGYYEASHRGHVRSVDRTIGDRFYKGRVLSTRLGNSQREGEETRYLITDVRRDDGSKWTGTVHGFVLLAHDRPRPPGMECCHGPGGPLDNRWPENLRWGTKVENEADKPRVYREPKPPKPCINHDRCGGYVHRGGRRCHPCVVDLGEAAAALLEETPDLKKVADMLGYASPEGVFKLAVDYGGARVVVDYAAATVSHQAADYTEQPKRRLRRVLIWWKAWLGNSDVQ